MSAIILPELAFAYPTGRAEKAVKYRSGLNLLERGDWWVKLYALAAGAGAVPAGQGVI